MRFIDHDARARAESAHLKIDGHEDRCAERWREARDQMKEMRDDIRGLRQTSRSTLMVLIGWGIVVVFSLWERLA